MRACVQRLDVLTDSTRQTQRIVYPNALVCVYSRRVGLIDRDPVSSEGCGRPIVRPGKQAGLQYINDGCGIIGDGAIAVHLHGSSADDMHRGERLVLSPIHIEIWTSPRSQGKLSQQLRARKNNAPTRYVLA